jgi:heme-degrading monooxygenase HmoA
VLCAHTVRRLKPGTFDQFAEKFGPPEGQDAPPGWKSFHMARNLNDENEVVTFGFFDGSLEELEATQRDHGYEETRASVDDIVESVVANGVYEIVKERQM